MKLSKLADYLFGKRCTDGTRDHCDHTVIIEVLDKRCEDPIERHRESTRRRCCHCGRTERYATLA